jgi:lipase
MTTDQVDTRYATRDVPVRGGRLRVGVWEPEGEPAGTVLAVHGITASHRAWPLLAQALPDVRVIAPDLRGRGRSNGLPGPYGMPSHAEDMVAVLDDLAVERAVVVGHSMGGFVAVVLAHRHPERVSSLVLVDGGMPLTPPDGVTPDELAGAVLGPAAERLQMTFPERAAYRQFFRQHPAFAADWSPACEDYADYDLEGEEPALRPATRVTALHEDIRELVDGDSVLRAVEGLRHEARWLLAPRGLLDEVPPLYPEEARAAWQQRVPALRTGEVAGVNHYTIVMTERGVRGVVPAVREALAT